jgi:hypothetical protein
MFTFNPGNEDQSGRILGGAAVGAAQTTAGAQQQLASDIGSSLMSLATSYAGAKADAAELEGYDEVFKMHGNQLGFSGEDVDRFLKMPGQQRRAAYTSLYQNFLPHEQRMEYLNNQAALYPRGGAGGGGGQQKGYQPRQGWVGY